MQSQSRLVRSQSPALITVLHGFFMLYKDCITLLNSCTFKSEGFCAAAEASITSCSFMGVRKVAVSVYGEKSVLKMANSKLKRQLPKSKRGNTSSFVDKDGFLGVCVTEKADAQLRDIEMRDLLRCVSLSFTPNSVWLHIRSRFCFSKG